MSVLSERDLLAELCKFDGGPLAFDFETFGTDATDPDTYVRSVGLANAAHCIAIDLAKDQLEMVCKWLAKQDLIAHNYVFDGSWIKRYAGHFPTAWFDTYGMFRQLASEGWLGQTWGLKTAMVEVLGWKEPNDLPLLDWLTANGLSKSKMALAPWNLLGEYNALDAGATWQLYEYFSKVLRDHEWGDLLLNYHQLEHCGEIDLLIEQQFGGMKLDMPKLRAYSVKLEAEVKEWEQKFKEVPEIAQVLSSTYSANDLIMQDTAPELYKKDGNVSKNWLTWLAKYGEADEAGVWKFSETKLKNKKTGEVKVKKNWKPFNINSTHDLRQLFYKDLDYEPTGYTVDIEEEAYKHTALDYAKTDTKSLPYIGPGGVVLGSYRNVRDELKFVRAALGLQRGGVFHPKVKSVATVTGRLGGGSEEIDGKKYKLNIQQLPKRRGFLECFVARDGHKIVYTDFSALEMKVSAIASKDKNLYHLYGPKANPNHDVYLFNGAQIPQFRDGITELYDLDNPTREGVAKAKKVFSKQRQQIFKPWVLGSVYGLGPHTMLENYTMAGVAGVDIKFCFMLSQVFRDTYAGMSRLQRKLKAEWSRRDGWFVNLRGRPMCVDADKIKDIVNRNIQSSGHDYLMLYLQFLARRIQGKATPWLVDEHDATMWEVPDENVDFVKEQFDLAFDDLNEALGHDIKFDGDTKVASNLAELKIED